MYIRLIRNKPQGNAITGRLVIDGRWYCNTLERVGYQIPALCYHVAVTQSPKFKRLLPLVTGVPRTGDKAMRQGIRFHRGTKPEHSTGCILVVGDNNNNNSNNINQQLLRSQQHSERSGEGNSVPLGCVVPQRNVVEDKVVDVIYSKFFITFAVDLHLKYGIRPSLCLVETCQQRSVPILYTSKNWIVRWAMTPYL